MTSPNLGFESHGSGVPVLLIHGTQPDRAVFAPLLGALAGRCRAIAYDRRGFGRSDGAAGADFDLHAADAAALIDRAEARPAVVVGWSWGALVAMELAAARPGSVRALVLVEPAFHLKKHPTPAVLRAVLGAILKGKLGMRRRAVDGFFRWALGRRGHPSTYETMDQGLRDIVHANAPAILAEIGRGTGERLSEARVAGLRLPVTVVTGTLSDPAFIAAARRVAGLIPGARLVEIADAGHAIPLDRPQALAEVILGHATAAGGASASAA